MIVYDGPSEIDGNRVIAVVTGLKTPSVNTKTGPMAQVYILRGDMHPMMAAHQGADFSICGNCRHRGRIERSGGINRNVGRSCYVTLMHGPTVVWRNFLAGKYEHVSLAKAARELAGRKVRVGAYGDPAAVPKHVWDGLLTRVTGVTAYTHMWRERPDLSAFCMASVDSPAEREEARQSGFRTFRVKTAENVKLAGEGICPASNEMQKAVQCDRCMLCNGQRKGHKSDIVIDVHGRGRSHFAS